MPLFLQSETTIHSKNFKNLPAVKVSVAAGKCVLAENITKNRNS